MARKLLLLVLLFVTTLSAENDIFIYSENPITKLKISLKKEEEGFYREYFKTRINYYGYNLRKEEKIIPEKYTQEINLISIDRIFKPTTMTIDSINLQIQLESTDLYGRDFYKLVIDEGDKIKCEIYEGPNIHNGFIEVASKTPKDFNLSGSLKVISVNMILDILRNYVSAQNDCWSISGSSILSDFFETIEADNLPAEDFTNIKIVDVDKINIKNLKFQAMNKAMDRMQEIKFVQRDENSFDVPNIKFYNLTCWYDNKKQNIAEYYTLAEYLDRSVTFNYVFEGKAGQYTKPAGKVDVYLPYPVRKIESMSCDVAGNTKAVTLKDNHTISIDEPIAVVLDLNSTRTTNKKNKFDYLDFVKRLYDEAENSQVGLFKLLYVFPREATFEKFNITKVYTKFRNTKFNTVNADNAPEFVAWRQNNEKTAIDPLTIPDDYFCMELIKEKSFFDKGFSTTLVKENMADSKYVQNFEYVLKRLESESGYKFKKVYYVSYFPVLPMYKIEGIEYISFLENQSNFNLSNITN
ncbi:MAG: hypothetical protein JXQ65_05955 [Candidatus Marinimicrobia bacterium]|nr:hypothetical protein [Candidatus Neomarinimicrobiota bacterium]